jgi:hypothetical protein
MLARDSGKLPRSTDECSLDEGAVIIDQAGQEPQMDDRPVAGRYEVYDLAHRGCFLVSGDNKSAWVNLSRIAVLPLSHRASMIRGIGLRRPQSLKQFL